MNKDIWELIGLSGNVLFILNRVVKDFDIRYIAAKKIQSKWRQNSTKREFSHGDRVVVYDKLSSKLIYGTVVGLNECGEFINIRYNARKRCILFYNPRLKPNIFLIKKLSPWKY